jgi:L-threonylcarbamoyladenylate synthase
VTVRRVVDDEAGRAAAIEVLRAGGIVALPTDTVYGIGVALDAPSGITRLFEAKRRPADRSIALLVADLAQAESLGAFGLIAHTLAAAFWPGGLTIVVPPHAGVRLPAELSGGAATVGVRMPDHPTPRALAAAVGPLPTTSANRSGEPEARDADAIEAALGDAIDLILDAGAARGGPASTVVDCTAPRPRVLRVGAIPLEAIEALLEPPDV